MEQYLENLQSELYCLGLVLETFETADYLNLNYQPLQYSFNKDELDKIATILNNKFKDTREYRVFAISQSGLPVTKKQIKKKKKKKE